MIQHKQKHRKHSYNRIFQFKLVLGEMTSPAADVERPCIEKLSQKYRFCNKFLLFITFMTFHEFYESIYEFMKQYVFFLDFSTNFHKLNDEQWHKINYI